MLLFDDVSGTELDGDKPAYRSMLVKHAARAAGGPPPDPAGFAPPMRAYDPQTAVRTSIWRSICLEAKRRTRQRSAPTSLVVFPTWLRTVDM